MDKVYYNSARSEILKKLSFLRDRNFVDFFEESLPFTLAINLAYFGLAEDVIITRDNDDINIATRFTRNVSQDDLANLFPVGHGIEISKKEQNGNSREWFLSTLRNGIFHNGLTVDYGKRKVKVENDGFLNELECSVPFEWFDNFIDSGIIHNLDLDNYSHTLFFFDASSSNNKIVDEEGINNFIENELVSFTVNFSIKEGSVGPKISRNDFLSFCNKKTEEFRSIYSGDCSDDYQDEIKNVEKIADEIKKETTNEKSTLSPKDYDKLLFSETFKRWYLEKFKNEFPNYDVSLEKFKNNNYVSKLFKRYKERKYFYSEIPSLQRRFIVKRLSNIVNYDKVDYLEKIESLKFLFEHCSRMMRGEDRDFDAILRSTLGTRKTTGRNIEKIFIERAYQRMRDSEIPESYDQQITVEVLNGMNFIDDEIHNRCLELNDAFDNNKSYDFEDYFNYIVTTLSEEFPNYYQEQSDLMKKAGRLPDYIESKLHNFEKDKMVIFHQAKRLIVQNMDDVIEALLYTLGINTYVMNKENVFKDFGDSDYSFMDGLNISGYSKDSYTNLCDVRSKKRKHVKSFNGINKNIGNLDNALANISDPNRKSELTILRNQRAAEASREQAEIIRCDNYINSIDEMEYDGVRLASLDNNQCATTIRNCFAHCDRIHVDGRDKNGEVFLTLTDYDENGNLSGIVKTDLTSIIRFLSHDTFYKEVNKEVVAEDTSVNALIEPPIIETEEVVNSKGSKK